MKNSNTEEAALHGGQFVMKFLIKLVYLIFALSIIFAITSIEGNAALPNHFDINKAKEIDGRKAHLTTKSTHKRLSRAHRYLNEKSDISKALEILNKLEKTTASRPFEKALVQQTIGYAYLQKPDYKKALKYFELALASKKLPAGPTKQLMYNIARIHINDGNFKLGKEKLVEWFQVTKKPTPQAQILMATILMEQKKKLEALEYVEAAINSTSSPQESWLKFAVALNLQLKRYKPAAVYLEGLVAQFPKKKEYWKQLSGVYLNLENTEKSLAALDLAHKMGFLEEEQELLNLVSLYMLRGYPYQAGKLLSKWIKEKKIKNSQRNFEILAQAWLQSEEVGKAIAPMEQAAALSDKGQLWVQQAQLYMDVEKWDSALKAFGKGLKKGGVKNKGRVHLAMGIVKFNLNDTKGAMQAFEKAKSFDKSKDSALQWINHLAML